MTIVLVEKNNFIFLHKTRKFKSISPFLSYFLSLKSVWTLIIYVLIKERKMCKGTWWEMCLLFSQSCLARSTDRKIWKTKLIKNKLKNLLPQSNWNI